MKQSLVERNADPLRWAIVISALPWLLLFTACAAWADDVIVVDEGCRLVRKPAVVVKRKVARKPAPAASAASAPAPIYKPHRKPRRSRLGLYPVPADYDLLCDEDEHTPATFTPVPEVPFAIAEPDLYVVPQAPLDLYVVPLTFDEGIDEPQAPIYTPPGTIDGPCCYTMPGQIPAAPEPKAWGLMVAGLGIVLWRTRR